MNPCTECKSDISEQAPACPYCGAPYPVKDRWDGWGLHCKSQKSFLGLPLVSVSCKYHPNPVPVVVQGIIAIGQSACGIETLLPSLGFALLASVNSTLPGMLLPSLRLPVA